MLDIFMCFTPTPNRYPIQCRVPVIGKFYKVENSVDPDQLASEKQADLDLHSFNKKCHKHVTNAPKGIGLV